jgi:hypothetical protein
MALPAYPFDLMLDHTPFGRKWLKSKEFRQRQGPAESPDNQQLTA